MFLCELLALNPGWPYNLLYPITVKVRLLVLDLKTYEGLSAFTVMLFKISLTTLSLSCCEKAQASMCRSPCRGELSALTDNPR